MEGPDGKPLHIPDASQAAADGRAAGAAPGSVAAIAAAERAKGSAGGATGAGVASASVSAASSSSYTLEVPVNFAEGLDVTLAPGAYSTFTFAVPEGAGFAVNVEVVQSSNASGGAAAALDFEAYLGRRNCPKPTRSNHHFSCTEGENLGKASITVPGNDVGAGGRGATGAGGAGGGGRQGTVYYLGATPYKCNGCNVKITVMLEESPKASTNVEPREDAEDSDDVRSGSSGKAAAAAAAAAAAGPKIDGDRCGNCGVVVPPGRMRMHAAFCERNNTKCLICDAVVKKTGGHHWHCDLCLEPPFACNSLEAKAKHQELYHAVMQCECGKSDEMRPLMTHRETSCTLRQVICRFCDAAHAAGDPPADAVDRHLGFTSHEAYCGAKTTKCKECNDSVRNRVRTDTDTHTHTDTDTDADTDTDTDTSRSNVVLLAFD